MKSRDVARVMLAILGLAALPAQAASSLTDQQRFLRLHDAPITLYAEATVAASGLPGIFNTRARPDDAIVVPHVDALKVSARLSSLGITQGEIWVHLPREMDITQAGRRNLEGAKGIVFAPAAPRSGFLSAATARRVGESAATLGCRLIVGLEPELTRNLANVGEISRDAAILTIYDNQRLRQGGVKYRAYVERIARAAREVNPAIKIEVCIATGRDVAATKALAGVLWTCADLVDRIGIYCDDSAESRASLDLLYQVLRGKPSA